MMGPRACAKLRHVGAILALALAAIPGRALAENVVRRPVSTVPSFLGYVPDELVVVFKQTTAHQLFALPPQGDRARANLERVQTALDRVAARSFDRLFVSAKPQAAGSRLPDLTRHYVVKLAPGMDLDEAKAELERSPDVDHVEKNGIHTLDATPNDRYYLNASPPAGFPWKQWHYWDTYGSEVDVAWDTETGDPNVVTGMTDSGVRYYHSDLGGSDVPGPADNVTNGNIWVNPLDPPGGGDNDGNGFADDVIGWDFVSGTLAGANCYDPDCATPDNDPADGDGHGTHTAGTVGAITNNTNRVAGVAGGFAAGAITDAANGAKLLPLRIGYHTHYQGVPTGVVTMSWAAQAFNYVANLVDAGINVTAMNCSWGSSNSGGLSDAVTAVQARDVLVVVSAGNSNTAVSSYLPTLANVLCVGASDSLGVGASFSSFGPLVDLAAPGVHILSTYSPNEDDNIADGDYVALLDGTSMSTPHVVGAAAVLESYNPALTAAQKAALLTTHVKAFAPANTKVLGSGILDLAAALANAPAPVGVGDVPVVQGPRLKLRAFPNPARAGSDLAVQARAGDRVELRIVDAAGRMVRAMNATADAGGAVRLRWDGRDSSGQRAGAGLYFVAASAGGERASHKLVVLE